MAPRLANTRSDLARAALRIRAHARRVLSIGITGRLTLAFAAVAVLAVAANLIIERGGAVVQTTRLDRGQFSPIPAARTSPAPPVPAAKPTNRADESSADGIDRQRFLSAVDEFQRAIEVRASTDSNESAGAVQAAMQAAESAVRAPWLERRGAAGAVEGLLFEYEQAGLRFVQSTESRRAAVDEYLGRVDATDGRITVSLDGAWKLFGRVFARESLLRLHAQIEELGRRVAALSSAVAGGDEDTSALEAVASAESAFASSLRLNESALVHSEGTEWTRRMQEDLSRLAELRQSIAADYAETRDSAAKFAAAHASLLDPVSEVRLPEVRVADVQPSAAAHPAPRAPAAPALPAPALASPVIGSVTTTTVSPGPDADRRAAVAVITAAVLLILLAISIWTVRSILIPVRGMLEATGKLAGGLDVRVPRGGLKELDTLAIAFNRMASQLKSARDITQDYRQHLESQVEQRTRQLQYLAEHDPLTLLANRRQFFVLLNRSLQRAEECDCGVAVFFIDLDNFKNLNDGMGHAFGDRVLISVAQRLEETARGFGFAARLGGDEFTVVYEEVLSLQDAYDAGRKLVEAFQQALRVEGREVTVSASIGASLYPDHEMSAEDLLSAADAALFHAKALGRNQLAMFTAELLETATRKFTTEQGIRRALERDEFELVFQPEVDLETLEVGLVEALVRWRLPDGRLATPDEFLAVTEESGLIVELGNWVLRRAIETASQWHRGLWPDVKIAINVSARQLLDNRFAEGVRNLLREYRLPPHCIELELTESVLQTGAATIDSLRLLRSLGVAIALDDFGTGYSSFASLEQLPLSRIKLDRTLIAGIDTNARSAAIALALIQLCDDLHIEVTAEGVERESQFGCLAVYRELYLQGYLLSRPVAAAEVLGVNRLMPQIVRNLLRSIPVSGSRADLERRRARRQGLTVSATKR
jgi:diguanylate cyclase (GGDEF)-like protein